MDTCLVLGSEGLMGSAISYALRKLGYVVSEVDLPRVNLAKEDLKPTLDKIHPAIVVSALPYTLNRKVAIECIDNKIPYCDLGGHVQTSSEINLYAQRKKSKVFVGLGLAPGYINIIAEEGFRQIGVVPESVEMAVGGIPIDPSSSYNPLKYNLVWSVDGLFNQYVNTCTVLQHGEIIQDTPLTNKINININNKDFEAFYTSGGSSHSIESMQSKGVLNCSYRTIRWPGHCELIQWLVNSKTSPQNIKQLISHISYNSSLDANNNMVVLWCRIKYQKLMWLFEKIVCDDERWTSMQKLTAFPCAAIVDLMVKNLIKTDKYCLSYNEIDYDIFINTLAKLDKTLI